MRKLIVVLSAAVVALVPLVIMSPAEAAAYQVTAAISTESAQSGDGPGISGALSPATPGKMVYLQRYYSDAWHTIKTATTDGAGHYAAGVTPAELGYKVGSMKFRAKVLATGATTAGASPSITKTIYGWQSLAYMDATYGDSRRFFDGNDEFTIDANVADDGWHILNPLVGEVGTRYTKWNLQEKCIRLSGFAGLDTYDSAAGAQGRFVISVDGTAHDYARNFTPHEIETLYFPLYKTHYLALKGYKFNNNNTVVGVGEPEVLCSKKLPTNF